MKGGLVCLFGNLSFFFFFSFVSFLPLAFAEREREREREISGGVRENDMQNSD